MGIQQENQQFNKGKQVPPGASNTKNAADLNRRDATGIKDKANKIDVDTDADDADVDSDVE